MPDIWSPGLERRDDPRVSKTRHSYIKDLWSSTRLQQTSNSRPSQHLPLAWSRLRDSLQFLPSIVCFRTVVSFNIAACLACIGFRSVLHPVCTCTVGNATRFRHGIEGEDVKAEVIVCDRLAVNGLKCRREWLEF